MTNIAHLEVRSCQKIPWSYSKLQDESCKVSNGTSCWTFDQVALISMAHIPMSERSTQQHCYVKYCLLGNYWNKEYRCDEPSLHPIFVSLPEIYRVLLDSQAHECVENNIRTAIERFPNSSLPVTILLAYTAASAVTQLLTIQILFNYKIQTRRAVAS